MTFDESGRLLRFRYVGCVFGSYLDSAVKVCIDIDHRNATTTTTAYTVSKFRGKKSKENLDIGLSFPANLDPKKVFNGDEYACTQLILLERGQLIGIAKGLLYSDVKPKIGSLIKVSNSEVSPARGLGSFFLVVCGWGENGSLLLPMLEAQAYAK